MAAIIRKGNAARKFIFMSGARLQDSQGQIGSSGLDQEIGILGAQSGIGRMFLQKLVEHRRHTGGILDPRADAGFGQITGLGTLRRFGELVQGAPVVDLRSGLFARGQQFGIKLIGFEIALLGTQQAAEVFLGVIEPAGGEGDGSRLLERQGVVGIHGQDRRPGLRRGLGLTAVFGQLGVADELVRITLHPHRGSDRRAEFRRVVQFGQRRDIRLAHFRQTGGAFRLDHRHGTRGAAEI